MPAFCIKLEKVPGLSSGIKASLRRFIGNNRDLGIHNVPRRFNTQEQAVCGQVRENKTKYNVILGLIALPKLWVGLYIQQCCHPQSIPYTKATTDLANPLSTDELYRIFTHYHYYFHLRLISAFRIVSLGSTCLHVVVQPLQRL